MPLLFLLAALAPACVALGLVLWRRYVAGEQAAGSLIGSVAIGLAAGALLGAAVALTIVLFVMLLARSRGH